MGSCFISTPMLSAVILWLACILCSMTSAMSFSSLSISFVSGPRPRASTRRSEASRTHLHQETKTAGSQDLTAAVEELWQAVESCRSELTKTCKVRVSPNTRHRLGLIATESISKGEVMLAIPFEDRTMLTAKLAREVVFADVLPESYDGWTGDTGLIALLILNEVARAAAAADKEGTGLGTPSPKRSDPLSKFMQSWVKSLPLPQELSEQHPFLWSEEAQEVLQLSSTNKIYRKLDDIEEDINWWINNVFQKDRNRFPETVQWTTSTGKDGQTTKTTINCFNLPGFTWAMALASSRSCFLDGSLRLIPIVDMCNHDDDAEEVQTRGMGTFGSLKGATLIAADSYKAGDEVFCSYGPKSAADYLLEHGFCPESCWKTCVSELTFEIDPNDRFYDDKLDILEYETYEQEPMDPTQSFDVTSVGPGGARGGRGDGEPDPAMMQFLRLAKLGGTDAFLLESIFRKDVWGFMALPVSEKNELEVVNTIIDACQSALDELRGCPEGGPDVCSRLRESESRALTRTVEYLSREREALDLKEYYQERRLKDLGLDSDWSPEEDMSSDLGFGQTRAPGGADYDW